MSVAHRLPIVFFAGFFFCPQIAHRTVVSGRTSRSALGSHANMIIRRDLYYHYQKAISNIGTKILTFTCFFTTDMFINANLTIFSGFFSRIRLRIQWAMSQGCSCNIRKNQIFSFLTKKYQIYTKKSKTFTCFFTMDMFINQILTIFSGIFAQFRDASFGVAVLLQLQSKKK